MRSGEDAGSAEALRCHCVGPSATPIARASCGEYAGGATQWQCVAREERECRCVYVSGFPLVCVQMGG